MKTLIKLLVLVFPLLIRAEGIWTTIGAIPEESGDSSGIYTWIGAVGEFSTAAAPVCDTIIGITTVTEKADALIFGTNITTNDSGTTKHYYTTDTTDINAKDSIVSLGVKDTITCTTSVLQPSDSIWWWVKFASDTGLCTDLTSKTLAITLDSTVAMDDDWIYRDTIPVVKPVARRKSKWSGWSWDGWGW